MRRVDEFEWVARLAAEGAGASEIARETGIPRSTVRDWLAPGAADRGPARARANDAGPPRVDDLPPSYPYLLGVYLGDGCLAEHPRQVYRLRISLDLRYPGIVEEVAAAVQQHVPENRVARIPRAGHFTGRPEPTLVEVSAYSKRWPALFPQHGPGRKHEREIALADWQLESVRRDPRGLLRGLIHSDGCRFINTGTNWRHPRYSFSNRSAGMRAIFALGCDLLSVLHTQAPHTVYVSRKADVALLDAFIGPKQ